MTRASLTTTAALIMLLPAMSVWPEVDAEDELPAVPEVTIGQKGSEQDPLSGRDEGLAVEPQEVVNLRRQAAEQNVPAMRVQVDPRVLGVAPGEPLPPLRREGETLRQRDGQLLPTGDRGFAVFILDADPEAGDQRPMGVIMAPCMTLESMERLLEDRGDSLRFTITGQVHTYRGVNYLMPTSQPKPWLIDVDAEEQLVNHPDEPAKSSEGVTAVPDADAAQTPLETGKKQAAPTADDVLQQLLEQKRDSPTAEPTTAARETVQARSEQPAGRPAQPRLVNDPLLLGLDTDQPQAQLKDEGQLIIARTGRLLRSTDGSQALFVLESDGPDAPEAPMILQACKLLETMEKTVSQLGEDVPFVITGQVFTYRGANYLLPTIVKREFDRGNLE